MKKSELEQKVNEASFRLSKLEERLRVLQEENDLLKQKVNMSDEQSDHDARIPALSQELYAHIENQVKQLVQYIDEYKTFNDNRIHNFSDEIYQYVITQNQVRDERNEAYCTEQRNELWMRTYGFDNMIADLQLAMLEQNFPGNRKRLEALQDTHVGEKCFVIGNGPSLKAEDLDKLKEKGIFCFASNGIYRIFDETEWRPDIWIMSDLYYITRNWEVINKLDDESEKLICAQAFVKYNIQIKNAVYFPFIQAERTPRFFNKDVTKGVHFYRTVTGKLINFAVYMGFKEIYLVGCDNTNSVVRNENGQTVLDLSKKQHFSDKYFENNSEELKANELVGDIMENWKYVTKSYEDIKYFCDREQVKIVNATRGGALEVFPRADFEKVLEELKNTL